MIPALRPYLTWSDFFSYLSVGKNIDETFNEQLCRKFKQKHAITYSCGRAGLFHILRANNINKKKVLVTAYSCCVVTEAVVQSGNELLFIDTTEKSFNSEILESHLTEEVGAVIVSNIFGFTADYQKLSFLAKRKNFIVIIDDALAPEDISKVPTELYDYVYTSCAVRKPFTGLGGGVVLTNSDEKFELLKEQTLSTRKRLSWKKEFSKFIFSGLFFIVFRPSLFWLTSLIRRKTSLLDAFFSEKGNDIYQINDDYFFDMCSYQKRIANNQLKKLDYIFECRRNIGNLYFKYLKNEVVWITESWREGVPYSHVPFLHPNRDQLERYLLANSIDFEKYFDYVIPEIEQYKDKGIYPNASILSKQMINLPIYVGMSEKKVAYIASKIIAFEKSNNNK